MKIEKGIPLPPLPNPDRRARYGELKQIVGNMEPGDSILLPDYKSAAPLATAISYYWGQGNQAIRMVEGGYRVWRVN